MRRAVDWYVERADIYVERLAARAETPLEQSNIAQLRAMIACFACDEHPGAVPLIGMGLDRQEIFCGACEAQRAGKEAS